MTSSEIRELRTRLPHGLVHEIHDSSQRLFGFVLLEVAGAIIDAIAGAVEEFERRSPRND